MYKGQTEPATVTAVSLHSRFGRLPLQCVNRIRYDAALAQLLPYHDPKAVHTLLALFQSKLDNIVFDELRDLASRAHDADLVGSDVMPPLWLSEAALTRAQYLGLKMLNATLWARNTTVSVVAVFVGCDDSAMQYI
jgi:hypothetical protein